MPRRVRAGKPTGTDNQVTARDDAAFAHFLVEEYFGIELGVWGQLAAGGGGIFFPVPQDNSLRYRRRAQRIGHVGRVDMQRSERLVAISVAAWEEGIGRVKHVPSPGQNDLDRGDLEGVVRAAVGLPDRRRTGLGTEGRLLRLDRDHHPAPPTRLVQDVGTEPRRTVATKQSAPANRIGKPMVRMASTPNPSSTRPASTRAWRRYGALTTAP